MKHNLKRLTALILALSMTLSLLSATAWAAETDEDDTVTTGDTDLELEGTDDVGDLVVGALSETEEEQTAEENYICDVEVDGTTATVTYNISEASVDADVVVAIYDEDTQQMLASGTTTVSSDDSSCTVTIEGTMPTYFLVTAYLLEADTHQPLSSEYTSQLYTQEMQEFLAKTTDDFEEEQVLNLDDDITTNFLVYSEGTVVVDESSSAAAVTDNGDGTYTVTNADATFTGLQAGDALSYAYEDGTVLIVKVKSVSVNGSTVTITEDEDADLSDVFDYVKIEANGDNSTPTVDTSEAADGVTYLGNTVSASAIDKDVSYSNKVSWSVGDETDTETFKLGVKGTVSFGYNINVKLYIATSYQYASVKLDLKLEGDVTLTGKLDLVDIALGEIDIPLTVGVYAKLKLSFEVEFSASITFHFEVSSTVGAYYDSNESGIHSQCSSPSASYQTTFAGTVYVGLKLDGYITIVDDKMSKIGLRGKAGAEITMKEEVQALSSSSSSKVHTCSECYAGTVTGKFNISASVDLLNGKITVTADIWSYSDKLFDLYYSVDHDEWGFSTCPYISYLCTITVKNYSGDPVSGATVTCSGLEESLETDENGVVSFYLPNGTYSLTASSGTQQKKTSFTVYNNKKVLTVTVVNTQIDFDAEDPGTGDDDEDGDGSGSGDSSGSGGSSVTEVASGTCGDDLTWVLDEDYVLTISGTGKMTSWSSYSSVPWYSYRTRFNQVVIDRGVTGIGSYAFMNCTGLTSVTIPDSVTGIGNFAFDNCTSLTSVTIPDSVTNIGNWAFSHCPGPTTIPDSLTRIGDYAFYYCTSLTSVAISDSVTSIGNEAFTGCTSLTDIQVSENNTVYCSVDGVLFNKYAKKLICYPAGKTDISYNIPDSVTSIGNYAFWRCRSLTSVTIPNSVISIGNCAFYNCTSLASVTIPDSVKSIGNYAFYNCTSLNSVTIGSGVSSIGDWAFNSCKNLTDVYYAGSEDDWAAVSIGSCNTYLTDATIHYNYTVSASSVDESSESVTAAEAEPETDTETETEVESEPETEPEVEPETETGDESEPEAEITETTAAGGDLSLDYLLSGAGTVVPLMAYTGETTSTDNTQTAVFTGLVSGEAYVLLVVKDVEAESLLAADNLLYIAQASADDSGSVTFTYIPRETVESAVSYAYGTSSQNLADAEITLEAESFGYTGGAIKPLATVVYNGVTLEEDVDYTISYSNNTKIGTASVTIKGRGDYAGTVKKTFTIVKGTQSVTASVSASSIIVGKTVQITVAAQGTLSYESSDTAVAAVDENGLITGKKAGTATITVTAAETDNFESGSTTLTVKVLLTTPTLSSVSNTASGVKVTWKAVSGAAKYRVFRKTGSGSWAKVADTTSTSYTDTSAVSGTTYKYTVRCINSACTSYTSSYDTAGLAITRLSAPSLSSASNASSGITVKWAQVKGAQGYRIYRKAGSAANWTKVKTVSGGSTVSWTDTDVTNGTKYTYTVRAYSKASGSTDWSTYNTTGKTNYRLTRPTISSLKNVKTKKMTVKWGKNSKATGYQIYISTSSDFSSNTRSLTVSSYKTVSKTISGLTKGKKYYVRVRAYKTVSGTKYYSAWSSTKNVKISK